MRLTAYKKLIDSAKKLPVRLEGSEYFKTTGFSYSPELRAVDAILKKAREDTGGLFHTEFIELYNYSKKDNG